MKRVFLIIVGIVLLASCKKEDSEDITPTPPDPVVNYTPLEIGNYWAYQFVAIDPDGNESITSQKDSSIIVGDTMIRNELYYDMFRPENNSSSYLRDSSGFLVDSDGRVLFYDEPGFIVEDTIEPAMAVIEYTLQPTDTIITVPFGTFDAVTYKGTVTALNPGYPYGVQYTYYFYVDGVGQIKSSNYFFSNPSQRLERRLTNFGNINIGKSQDASW